VDGNAQIDAMIARLRGLRGFVGEAAKEAAPLVEAELRKTAAAGVDPEGKAWPTRRDGSRALERAATAITARAVGEAVVATLVGAYVFHHYAKGADRRRILPDSGAGVPAGVAGACREGARRAFRRLMGGA